MRARKLEKSMRKLQIVNMLPGATVWIILLKADNFRITLGLKSFGKSTYVFVRLASIEWASCASEENFAKMK